MIDVIVFGRKRTSLLPTISEPNRTSLPERQRELDRKQYLIKNELENIWRTFHLSRHLVGLPLSKFARRGETQTGRSRTIASLASNRHHQQSMTIFLMINLTHSPKPVATRPSHFHPVSPIPSLLATLFSRSPSIEATSHLHFVDLNSLLPA